jgi:glucose-6-phosphate isomerase
MSNLTHQKTWLDLLAHQKSFQAFSLVGSFQQNPQRARDFSLHAAGLFLDYSKHLINADTMKHLLALSEEQGLTTAIQALKNGANVNFTENRPALHHLLRCQNADDLNDSLKPLYKEVIDVKQRLKKLSAEILNGQLRGYTGKPFTDIVHIGIGGSDLGPAMVYQALKPYQLQGIRCHFVANICANDILEALENLSPHTTLFIVASKSFTTLETIKNADTARAWLLSGLKDAEAIGQHFMAVTSKPERAAQYGIRQDFILPFWDWVGGRYSVWSAINLSLCIGLGFDTVEAFLKGANAMDEHFFTAEHGKNMPVIVALLGIWYTNFWRRQSHMIAPYDHRLRRLPAFLQQLEMESNGKSASKDNHKVDYATCPAIWGEVGANSQHSFFQRLHQGPEFVPIDFIVALKNHHNLQEHQDWLFANCLAQSQALMLGQQAQDSSPLSEHKVMTGNRPSSTLIVESLTPEALGSLLAMYEHKVYVQSIIWEINAFDQWGVELGKAIGNEVKKAMEDTTKAENFDASTQQLLQMYHSSSEPKKT